MRVFDLVYLKYTFFAILQLFIQLEVANLFYFSICFLCVVVVHLKRH